MARDDQPKQDWPGIVTEVARRIAPWPDPETVSGRGLLDEALENRARSPRTRDQ